MAEVRSSVPGLEPKAELTYSDVIRALSVDVSSAETAFARLAKTALADLLHPFGVISTELPLHDIWVTQKTVVITLTNIPPLDDKSTLPEASTLTKLVYLMEADIQSVRGASRYVLMHEPLWVRVLKVSEHQYSFSLKQKWSVADER